MKGENGLPVFNFHPLSFIPHPFRTNSLQQRINARGLLFGRIADEVKRGSMPQIQRKAKLLAHIRSGMLQRPQRRIMFFLVAFDGHVNAGVAQVIGDAHFGHGYHRQSRILEFVTDDLRDLFTQSFSNALWPMHNCKDKG